MGLGVDQSTAQGAAQSLVTYRQQNPNNLNAISWIVDALGNTSPVVQALARAAAITSPRKVFNSRRTSRRSARSGAATGG